MPDQPMLSSRKGTDFHQRLKQATRSVHRRLESQLPLLDSGLTITRYRLLLRSFFGFYVPLESSMEACHFEAVRADLACRRKSRWLHDDLLSLGETHQTIGALPLCQELPPMTSLAEILGALYVVEGATLGGQIVVTSLRRSLGTRADQHIRYFSSYGIHVPEMWNAFIRLLEAAAYNPVQEQSIIESACRTFTSFERWLASDYFREAPPPCDGQDMRITRAGKAVLYGS